MLATGPLVLTPRGAIRVIPSPWSQATRVRRLRAGGRRITRALPNTDLVRTLVAQLNIRGE
jgi:hypothetical protein